MYNYAASVAFAVLAIALVFCMALVEQNAWAMRLCVITAGVAWFACYAGYIHDEVPSNAAGYISFAATFAAIVFYVWALTALRS